MRCVSKTSSSSSSSSESTTTVLLQLRETKFVFCAVCVYVSRFAEKREQRKTKAVLYYKEAASFKSLSLLSFFLPLLVFLIP